MTDVPDPVLAMLDNGLRVLVVPVQRPAIAVHLVIDAGARDELGEEHGLAHLLEHMIFKGTAHRPVGRTTADVESLGGDLNAWTAHDQTSLHATIEAGDGWRGVVDVMADMLLHPTLDPDELQREIDVVLEEMRGYDQDPDSVLADRIQAALWPDHPYGRRILGTERGVRGHTADRLRGMLTREYTANRARLVVAGPVDPSAVIDHARRVLGAWRPGEPRRAPEMPVTPVAGPRIVAVNGRFSTTAVEIAWRLPPAGHPDLPALEVLAAVLGQGEGAELANVLQRDEHLAFNVWAEVQAGMQGSTFSLGFTPFERSTRRAIEVVIATLDAFSRLAPGPAVERSRGAMVADFLFQTETVDAIAGDVAWYDAHHPTAAEPVRPGGARRAHRDAIACVDAAEVARVAERWLSRERAIIGVLDPELNEATLRKVLRRAPTPPEEPVARWSHPRGPTLLVAHEASPLGAVRLLAPGGDLRLTPAQAGLAALWSRTLLGGAGGRDAQAIGETLDMLSAECDPITGRSWIGLTLTAPAANLPALLDLVGDLVLDPHFDAEEHDRTREELLDDLRTRDDRPSELAFDLSRALRWHGHPWALPALGAPDTLARLTHDDVKAFHQAHLRGPGLYLGVVGGLDPDTVDVATGWLDELAEDATPVPTPPAPAPRLEGVHVLHGGQQQAILLLTMATPHHRDPSRFAHRVLWDMLDGQGGRLFLRLREELALAYELWALQSESPLGGTLRIGMSCDPARIDAASSALREVLGRLAQDGPDADEVHRAQRTASTQLAIELQRGVNRVAWLTDRAALNHPDGPAEARAGLWSVRPTDVRDAMQRALDGGVAEIRVLPKPPPKKRARN